MATKSYSLQKISNPVIRYFLYKLGKKYDLSRNFPPFSQKPHQNDVLKFFNHRCCYCLNKIDIKNFDFDHLIPINRTSGGLHAWGNLAPACKSCNKLKSEMTWDIFMDYLFFNSKHSSHKNPKINKRYFSNEYSFESRKNKINLFIKKYKYKPEIDQIKIEADNLYSEIKAITEALIIEKIERIN